MNAFEDIVRQYLEAEGYWVRQSVKVEISREDKLEIGLRTMPRPEIDLVALNAKENELLLVEVKSFLDSQGVYFGENAIGEFKKKDSWASRRYRLFADSTFREVVTKKLKEEFLQKGLINDKTKINYALAVGKFYSSSEPDTKAFFLKKGWKLFTPQQIKEKIKELAEKGWEDNLATITAKLILRGE